MTSFVVTQGGAATADLLGFLLPEAQREGVRILAGGDRASTVALGRSLLATRQQSVALLIEADTADASLAATMRADLEALLGSVSGPARFAVVLAVPSLEVVFWQPTVISELAGEDRGSNSGFLLVGQLRPRHILSLLTQEAQPNATLPQIAAGLSPQALSDLRSHELIRELVAFIGETEPLSPPHGAAGSASAGLHGAAEFGLVRPADLGSAMPRPEELKGMSG